MERCAREVRQRATETVLGTEYIQKNEFINMPDGTVFSSVFFLLAFLLLQSFATFYLLLLPLLAAVGAAFTSLAFGIRLRRTYSDVSLSLFLSFCFSASLQRLDRTLK